MQQTLVLSHRDMEVDGARRRENDGETKMGIIKYAVIRDACLSLVLAACRHHYHFSMVRSSRRERWYLCASILKKRKKLNGILSDDILSGNKKNSVT